MKSLRKPHRLFRGELVEVRTSREISETLDENGKLDGVPFMPEMIPYCGERVRVFRRADKTCVEGHGLRRLESTVLLEDLRCDGASHDGCQRNCLFFWKEAWLKPIDEPYQPLPKVKPGNSADSGSLSNLATRHADRYYCQSTELYAATSPLSRWNVTQFLREMLQGELTLRDFFQIFFQTARTRFLRLKESGLLVGTAGKKQKGDLNLQPGEWIDVKKPAEIEAALDAGSKNCGLAYVPSMSEYIGGRYQVEFPVKKIILEQTGKMVTLTNTVALKGVNCQGVCVKNCPRSSNLYWRESWLQRVDSTTASPN